MGRVWARSVHTSYVEGRLSYSIFERHEDHELKRSHVSLEGGAFLTPLFGVRVLGAWQRTYGGINWQDVDISDPTEFHSHDALANANYYSAGAGVFYRMGRSATVSVTYAGVLTGQNTHDGHGFTVGTSWRIGSGNGAVSRAPGVESEPAMEDQDPG